MPHIKSDDNQFSEDVPYGSEWQQLAEYYENLPIKFGCRHGDCGVCRIKIIEGQENLTRMGPQEKKTLDLKQIPEGWRLACQCAIKGDITFS
jgi:ferredoxin